MPLQTAKNGRTKNVNNFFIEFNSWLYFSMLQSDGPLSLRMISKKWSDLCKFILYSSSKVSIFKTSQYVCGTIIIFTIQ